MSLRENIIKDIKAHISEPMKLKSILSSCKLIPLPHLGVFDISGEVYLINCTIDNMGYNVIFVDGHLLLYVCDIKDLENLGMFYRIEKTYQNPKFYNSTNYDED